MAWDKLFPGLDYRCIHCTYDAKRTAGLESILCSRRCGFLCANSICDPCGSFNQRFAAG